MLSLSLETSHEPNPEREAWDRSSPEQRDAQRILDAARALLRQGEELLLAISPMAYARGVAVAFNGSIGGHYRHCLDHFVSLLRGPLDEFVDYDRRERDERLERDRELALSRTRELLRAFEAIQPEGLDQCVGVRCEVSYTSGVSPVTYSSLGRELVYAIAHGIHHFALIAVMGRLQGVALPPHFGIAPSTVAHLAGKADR